VVTVVAELVDAVTTQRHKIFQQQAQPIQAAVAVVLELMALELKMATRVDQVL
jgi:hypothetical protein